MKELGVEVFYDRLDDRRAAEIGRRGVRLVQLHAKNILLSEELRSLRFANVSDTLDPEGCRLPKFDADLNIVMTSRAISVDNPARAGVSFRDKGVAFVSTRFPWANLTVSHEMGHLLHLEYPQDKIHCVDDHCIMFPEILSINKQVSHEMKGGARKLLERSKILRSKTAEAEEPKQQKFCDSCAEQLGRKAFYLAEYRNGNQLAKSWLSQTGGQS